MNSKTCTKCGENKLLTFFYKDKRMEDGRRPDCKSCKKAYQNQYYIGREDKIKARVAKRYYDDRESILARERELYKRRKEWDRISMNCFLLMPNQLSDALYG